MKIPFTNIYVKFEYIPPYNPERVLREVLSHMYGVGKPTFWQSVKNHYVWRFSSGKFSVGNYLFVWQLRHGSATGPRNFRIYKKHNDYDWSAYNNIYPMYGHKPLYFYTKDSTPFTVIEYKNNHLTQ